LPGGLTFSKELRVVLRTSQDLTRNLVCTSSPIMTLISWSGALEQKVSQFSEISTLGIEGSLELRETNSVAFASRSKRWKMELQGSSISKSTRYMLRGQMVHGQTKTQLGL
jgi:hypothetical protein